jgi:twitching motility protein PilT
MDQTQSTPPAQQSNNAQQQAAQAAAPAASQGQIRIEPLLDEVLKRDASDLHLQVGLPAMLRIDGALVKVENPVVLKPEDLKALVYSVLDDQQKKMLESELELDFSFAYGDLARFRVNAFHEKGNLAVALRLIPTAIRTIADLGLPKIIDSFTEYPRGLVLTTGPTGSGKSTTQAAMIDKINSEKSLHIITIEDPIEYQHHHKQSIVVQREVHFDTLTFGAGLRSALREDPDVILIGEMRDLETISTAVTLAETGHLVLATLHTNSASQSIDRMIDVFPPHQQQQIRIQLSNVLQAIVSQRLIPMVGGGRVAAAEILVVNSAVRNIIRDAKTHQIDAVIQTGAEQGMQTMDSTLVHLVHEGKISQEVARGFAVNVQEFERLMQR